MPSDLTTLPTPPCTLVIFGASGDLTKRLLIPALFNLACDGLLSPRLAIAGLARDDLTTEAFRERLTDDIRAFSTRASFDADAWQAFAARLSYVQGEFGDPAAYQRLAAHVAQLDAANETQGNLLLYLATPPSLFGLISAQLDRAGLRNRGRGWTRIIVEKPFGHDLASAIELNQSLLAHWAEAQIYRIDHYLGKETVQNLLAFRFSNGTFEPLWNKQHIDHVQISVAEIVGVESRGAYYDRTGVLRDMIQNHLLQMLAFVGMEPPASFRADAIRDEKVKLLSAVRRFSPAEAPRNAVRGQYAPGKDGAGTALAGYRQEPAVDAVSTTETFAALRLFVDNWRWEGVPFYLRSGKRLWKRGTEIVVQLKRAPDFLFQGTPAAEHLEANRLIFHIQPDQGIEFRFHAKTPGPALALQKVNMRFDYQEAFEASRGTGYEVLLYGALLGDATLFSRTDLVESAWQIAQPFLDAWASLASDGLTTYPAGSWGPRGAYELLERDGRRWLEVINRSVLAKVPLFQGSEPLFLHKLAMMLKPAARAADDVILRKGDPGAEMYFISRGQAEAIDETGRVLRKLGDGDFFGELGLLLSQPRSATIRAVTACDLFVLERVDFDKVLKEHPPFAQALKENARARYGLG